MGPDAAPALRARHRTLSRCVSTPQSTYYSASPSRPLHSRLLCVSGEVTALVIDARVSAPFTESLPALRERWRVLCASARVDVRIVDPDASPLAPPLFRQDAQLALVADTPAVRLRCDVLVRVRSDFWGRPLLLRVRVTPAADAGEAGDALLSAREPLDATLRLSDVHSHDLVLRLTRDEPAAVEPVPRTLECAIRVTKPLQLRAETRYMGRDRVCIVAKVTNTDARLALTVLDLQLHVNESYSMTTSSSHDSGRADRGYAKGKSTRSSGHRVQGTTQKVQKARRRRHFRVANDAHGQLPVVLQGGEQFNFLFLLDALDSDDGHDDDALREGEEDERGDVTSLVEQPPPHETLLTLSWEAASSTGGSGGRLAPPITEHHTIIWSPQSVSSPTSLSSLRLPASAFLSLVAPASLEASASVRSVRLHAQRALSLSLAAVPPHVAVGDVVTLCLVIANHSHHASFDLTLLAPFTPGAWFSFEATHRLGYAGVLCTLFVNSSWLVGWVQIHSLV